MVKTSADLYLVRVLLASIEHERCHRLRPLKEQLHAVEARLSAGDESASAEFWDLVRNGRFEEDSTVSLSQHAIAFVSEEFSRLKEI